MQKCLILKCYFKTNPGLPAHSLWLEYSQMACETGVQSQIESDQRLKKKWYLLNTKNYKVWIKGKAEQSRGRSSALPNTLAK